MHLLLCGKVLLEYSIRFSFDVLSGLMEYIFIWQISAVDRIGWQVDEDTMLLSVQL